MSTRDTLISVLNNSQSKFEEVGNEILFSFNDITLLTNGLGRVRKKYFGVQIPYIKYNNGYSNKYDDILDAVIRKDDISYVNTLFSQIETINWGCNDTILIDTINKIKNIHFNDDNTLIYPNYWENPNYKEYNESSEDNEEPDEDYQSSNRINTNGLGFLQKFLFPFCGMPLTNEDNNVKEASSMQDALCEQYISDETIASIRLEATLYIPSLLNKYIAQEISLKELSTFQGLNNGIVNVENNKQALILYTYPFSKDCISIVAECVIIDKSNRSFTKCFTIENSILGSYMLCQIDNMKHINYGICDCHISFRGFVRSLDDKFSLHLSEDFLKLIPQKPLIELFEI